METANYWYFLKFKGRNSVKNGSIVPKIKLDLDILTINLYTKIHFNMCIQCKENERKLQITGIFSKSKGHNSVKNGSIVPKILLGLNILTINLYTKFILICASSAKKMNGNCKLLEFFKVQGQ